MNTYDALVEELKDEQLLEVSLAEAPRTSNAQPKSLTGDFGGDLTGVNQKSGTGAFDKPAAASEAESGIEYFRRHAVDQVASLQMVEHVISGIEREYMKIVPASFDDLRVKKALHAFLKITNEPQSPEHLEAEGLLIYETESWAKALIQRDSAISVANVRRFCENSRPVLSSHALISLARFYRSSPVSEPVRAKFDFVMTRLFSHDAGDDRRRLLFGKLETIGHIRDLYENWDEMTSSDAVSAGPGLAEVLVEFRRFIDEAEAAESFDDLIATDFFNRTRKAKEAVSRMYFVPEATAAGIECNVRIGNRFVDLLNAEKSNYSVEALEEKYGYTYDSAISGAASKTLLLAELVKQRRAEESPKPLQTLSGREAQASATKVKNGAAVKVAANNSVFAVNRWLVAASFLALFFCAGIYLWSDGYSAQTSTAVAAADVNLANSGFEDKIRKGRATDETFYGIVGTSWDSMSQQQQNELVRKVQAFAAPKGLQRVVLLDKRGASVAYAGGERVEILKP